MNEDVRNPQAFPRTPFTDYSSQRLSCEAQDGMTLRDWFAGNAINGVLALASKNDDGIAKECYRLADAMIKERGK